MRQDKALKRQEKLLKENIQKYIKNADKSKIITEDQINEMVSNSVKNQYDSVNEYQKAKERVKDTSAPYRKLVFTSFLPLIVSGIISGSIIGITIANKDGIGEKYNNYYAYDYVTTVSTIDNVDYKLETHEYKGDHGYDVNLTIQKQEGEGKIRVYKDVYVNSNDADLYMQMLEQKQEIADEVNLANTDLEYEEKSGTLDKDIYKVTVQETDKTVLYSDTKKDDYHMPKKKKAIIWGVVLANIGLISSLGTYAYRTSDEGYCENTVKKKKRAKEEYKSAKKKMKLMRK